MYTYPTKTIEAVTCSNSPLIKKSLLVQNGLVALKIVSVDPEVVRISKTFQDARENSINSSFAYIRNSSTPIYK